MWDRNLLFSREVSSTILWWEEVIPMKMMSEKPYPSPKLLNLLINCPINYTITLDMGELFFQEAKNKDWRLQGL